MTIAVSGKTTATPVVIAGDRNIKKNETGTIKEKRNDANGAINQERKICEKNHLSFLGISCRSLFLSREVTNHQQLETR